MSLQSESKREEFRRYLEGAGVLDALTKVLVGLYEEPDKPPDALEYPRHTRSYMYMYWYMRFILPVVISVQWIFLSLNFLLSFVKKHLHGGPLDSIDAEALKKEVEDLRQKNRDLEQEVAQLKAAVSTNMLMSFSLILISKV